MQISPATFIAGDICNCPELAQHQFDLVTALSVADWNVDADGIVKACWDRVAPGGHLVLSLRLTDKATICDIARSFQYVWFDAEPAPESTERAPYNVFNVDDALGWLGRQQPRPEHILVYGYWGKPSASARTPYDRLLFAVIAMRKPAAGHATEPVVETHLPDDLKGRRA